MPAQAQDTNYWANQYGTRAELLGGTVTGALLDLSATYYNPGALAFADQNSLILTTDSVEAQDFAEEDSAPEGLQVSAQRIRPAPSLFAAQFSPRDSDHKFALSTVTRYNLDFRTTARGSTPADPGGGSPFPATSLDAASEIRLGEGWFGISWAHLFGERVGVGATTYLAFRSHFGRGETTRQDIQAPDQGSSLHMVDEFRYSHVRLFWKLGFAVDLEPLVVGLTFTSPSIGLYGRGERLINNGLTVTNPGGATNELVASSQRDLESTYKSAPAVSVGASYAFGNTRLYGTVEWFAGLKRYTVIDGQDFTGQTTGETESIDLHHALSSVFNWGLGLEHRFGDRWTSYAAFSTDRSNASADTDPGLTFSSWDLHHVTGGAAITIGQVDLTLGASYGWGQDEIPSNVPVIEPDAVTELTYRRLKLLFGFMFSFGGA